MSGLEVYYGDLCLTAYPYTVLFDGLEYGSPQTVIETLQSLMLDGDLEVSSRAGNRTLAVPVMVEGADFDELAENCEALAAEADKARNLLAIDPGDGFGAPAAFRTFRVAELPFDRSEAMEGARLRSYVLTVSADPFAYSDAEQTVSFTTANKGTARHIQHDGVIAGSARTEAELSLIHGSNDLGDCLIYSCPEDGRNYSPSLRQFATSATTAAATTDAARVSGKRNMLDTAFIAEVPAERLYEGRHQIIGLLRGSTMTGTAHLRVRVETLVGGDVVASEDVGLYISSPVFQAGVTITDGSDFTAWRFVHLGDIKLPYLDVGNLTNCDLRFTIVDLETTGIDIDLDDVWICNLDEGALTAVYYETPNLGKPTEHGLFLLPPTVTEDRPRLLSGDTLASAFNPGSDRVRSWGRHVVQGGTNWRVTTVTTGTTSAVLSAAYTPTWFTHPRAL